MRTCPYCGEQAITAARKAALGPIRSVPCDACGKLVSVSWASVLAVVPFILGIAAAAYLEASLVGIAALAIGAVAMFLIHEYAFPLVRRDGRKA